MLEVIKGRQHLGYHDLFKSFAYLYKVWLGHQEKGLEHTFLRTGY